MSKINSTANGQLVYNLVTKYVEITCAVYVIGVP